MVLGHSANKARGSPSLQLDYLINILEIKPWPPSQALSSLKSVVIQWEHGEKNSGSTSQVAPVLDPDSSIGSGRIEFNESFRVPVTLIKEISVKSGGNSDNFQKNCIEFNLYEPRRDLAAKGQLLGTAVIDFASYGIVKDSLSVSVPISCKRAYRNTVQPLLFLKIKTAGRKSGGKSVMRSWRRESSMDSSVGDSVSSLMNEEYAEEAETMASFTDDDVSPHSSSIVSSGVESKFSSSAAHKENGSEGGKSGPAEAEHDRNLGSEHTVKNLAKNLAAEPISTTNGSSADLCSDIDWISRKLTTRSTIQSTLLENTQDLVVERGKNPETGEGAEAMEEKGQHSDANASGRKSFEAENIERSNHVDSHSLGKLHNSNVSVRSDQFVLERKCEVLEKKIEMLEGELREAAGIEIGLFSVVAEHGSSTNKVHAPARRLSRLYFHACKEKCLLRRQSAARSVVSGLMLVAKACGNDVPRLTFWLSNCILLRAAICSFCKKQKLAFPSECTRDDAVKNERRSSPFKSMPKNNNGNDLPGTFEDGENPYAFVKALEKVESWIVSRTIESLWWQTFTPYMQPDATTKSGGKRPENVSLELWKKAFRDGYERMCPLRAGGHECGCLHLLSKLIMQQCVGRLDVAMFNAILRESGDDIPTDPVSDPISHMEVLPIPPGKASFSAGAQLKNVIGNWSRWLDDLFGIDIDDEDEDEVREKNADDNNEDERGRKEKCSKKPFYLLNALSDLMMLPKDMLLRSTTRKEVCPTFSASLIRRVLNVFIPDEFCPDPIPNGVLESLDSDDRFEEGVTSFPCTAPPVAYVPPSMAALGDIIGDNSNNRFQLTSGSSVLKKSYTSDDELDELDTPLNFFTHEFDGGEMAAPPPPSRGGSGNGVRYQLLREVWLRSE
ncbi:hypothetical protein DM860_000851 [Cuscuta australis]|uniref:C2 NT-type domain-containing protein n=1 Tax=Cuscuta australis TaxID=267555 RepID=A0A328CXC1_9ASTE|nr:hypothetical protein DM860_000851 [Cuscuta australis]